MHKPDERKATRACVDAKWAELEAAAVNAPRPTRKQKLAAAELCAPALHDRGEIPPWGVRGFLVVLTVVAVVMMLLVAGCVPMEAVEQAREEHAINLGHALDESLPLEARQIGADGLRAWAAQHRALSGDDLPVDGPGLLVPRCETCGRPAVRGPLPPELGPAGGGR